MEAHIIKKQILKDVQSASGIEVIGNEVYIVGNDSPYLYVFNKNLKLLRKILLDAKYRRSKERNSNRSTADLEAVASFDIGGEKVILILGSIMEARDKAFIVEPGDKDMVGEYSLVPLYNLLRSQGEIARDKILSIEAATIIGDHIYLFQKGGISGTNVMIEFPLYPFIHFIQDKNNKPPDFKVYEFDFEKHRGLVPGISGATNISGAAKIIFTASLEDTQIEWYDGAIFESYAGIISESKENFQSTKILESGKPFKGKIKSVAFLNKKKDDILEVLAVCGSDRSTSEILRIEIRL